jgi:hypothetical protein
MKTYVYLWQYFAEFFLKWESFSDKFFTEMRTQIL